MNESGSKRKLLVAAVIYFFMAYKPIINMNHESDYKGAAKPSKQKFIEEIINTNNYLYTPFNTYQAFGRHQLMLINALNASAMLVIVWK